jgi:hypothetical protein
LGNNSIICLKDKESVKRALDECLRVLRENGEIRLQPAGVKFKDREELHLGKMEFTNQEDADELMTTGKLTDKELFKILKDLEAQGVKFYSFGTKNLEDKTGTGTAFRYNFGNIILRKDDKAPQVNREAEDFQELRSLSFLKSEDDYYIPSEVVLPRE